ncbi:MAG: hypothetical protein IPH75_12885 [bacterium]|nr:hypothetical protein [bacterium]
MDAENKSRPLIIVHVVNMNKRIELPNSSYLEEQEAGKPPTSGQRAHVSGNVYHNGQFIVTIGLKQKNKL